MFEAIDKHLFEPFTCTKYNFKNLTGQVFNRLTVYSVYGKAPNSMSMWLCRCSCGVWKIVATNSLTLGGTQSCGCLATELKSSRSRTHGEAGPNTTVEYRAYLNAKRRCNNPNDNRYARYGGRGIKFLFTSYQQFLDELGRRPSAGYSVDRIDGDGHYEVGNVCWATSQEQARHTRRTHFVTIDGEKKCITEWCEIYQINNSTVHQRIRAGRQPIEAITTPVASL